MAYHQSSSHFPRPTFGCLLFTLALTGSVLGQADAPLEKRVEQLAAPYIANGLVAGMSIGVIRGDQQTTVHLGAAGQAGNTPTDDTIYEIASISKVFTGLLLADAVTRNELRLDQPAQDLLPDGVKMPSLQDKPITLEQIATHRSGLPRLANNMPSLQSDNPYVDYTSDLAHRFLNEHQLQRAPGEKHEYSNFAFALLGHLLAEQAGTSYDDLLHDRVTTPLGMQDTGVAMTVSMQERLATPHGADGKVASQWQFADMPGAGGIHSSVRDMLRFSQANLNPPQDQLGSALNLAWKKHQEAGPGEFAMGLAWHIAGDGSTRWHNGQTGGYHSMMMVNREARLAVIILANSATMEIDQLAGQIFQMLAGVKVVPRKFDETVQVAPKMMKRLEGRYQLVPNFVFTVKVEDNKLMVGVTNQPTLQVFPRSETEWFYKVVDATLTFKENKDGVFDSLELFQNGVRQTAKRVK